ncbi:MAG: ABC transporter permease [Acidimicrobiia bacterium]|jgi:ABC-2 type transport system permease protein
MRRPPSSLGQIWHIAMRDLKQRARSRAFLVTMVLVVGLALFMGQLIAWESGKAPTSTIGFTGEVPAGIEAALDSAAASFDVTVHVRAYPDRAGAEQAVVDGEADVALVGTSDLVWKGDPDLRLAAIVNSAVAALDRGRQASDLGLSPDQVAALVSPPPLTNERLTQVDPEAEPRRIGANIGTFVLYMAILMFGQFVMMGVTEEKASRVVEVVLSRVRPYQVLAGKVLGIGLLGLGQVVILGGAILLSLTAFDIANVSIPSLGGGILLSVIFWFLLGYAFYSVIYAALGATVSRQEDIQGVAMIPLPLLLPAFFISIIALEDPTTALVRITSMIPPTSPIVMPTRMAVTSVPAWEVAVSVGLLLAATYGLIRLGGRIYAGAILRIGAKVRLRDAWRAAE